MFIGHGLLALALVGLLARRHGLAPERALALAVVAALFATVPDVDVAYAPVALVVGTSAAAPVDAFWAASEATHRTVTHSVLVAVPAAAAFAFVPSRRPLALGLGLGLAALAFVVSGPLAATIMALFLVAGAVVAALAALLGFGPRETGAAALVGLVSHPFGDLLTGGPPSFLWPLDVSLLTTRIAPFADPTHDLFLAFGAELAAIWAGVLVAAALAGVRLSDHLRPRATAGAAFAVSVVVLPNPTVDAAYGFVAGILTTGAVGGVRPRDDFASWVVTGLAAVTVAAVAFAAVYLA
ncbi:MAG: metal-dependent hydrolase [Halobacteriaceae archaeon]